MAMNNNSSIDHKYKCNCQMPPDRQWKVIRTFRHVLIGACTSKLTHVCNTANCQLTSKYCGLFTRLVGV